MLASLRKFYGRAWRQIHRPAALKRAGGKFSADGLRYLGGAACTRCNVLDEKKPGRRSILDCAHLEIQAGEPGHLDPSNLGMLCRKCHNKLDEEQAQVKAKETRLDTKDGRRRIAQMGVVEISNGDFKQQVGTDPRSVQRRGEGAVAPGDSGADGLAEESGLAEGRAGLDAWPRVATGGAAPEARTGLWGGTEESGGD